jgi:hypothetical protein
VIALQEKPLSSVNRRPTLAALPAAEPVFTAFTATTASETFTVWLYPQDDAFPCTFADPRNGTICANNPINFHDPYGLIDIEALEGRQFIPNLISTSPSDAFFVQGANNLINVANIIMGAALPHPSDSPLQQVTSVALFALPGANALKCSIAAKSELTTVTSWADKGITPDLNPGRWVMKGEPTKWNFWKSGLPGPKVVRTSQFPYFRIQKSQADFSNFITDKVPTSSLQLPPGPEVIKAPLGQRVLGGGD